MNMAANTLHDHLNDPGRLAALRAVALLDTPTEEAFDRLSRLAARFTRAPVTLVSLVDTDRQFFKSCIGLPEPWNTARVTPLSHSFCQHNRVAGVPLIITDAREDPLFRDNLAIRDLNVIAYLGIPLISSDSYVLGSFCVIDSKPRSWTEEEVETVRDLAAAVMTEIALRTEISERKKAEGSRDELAAIYASLQDEIAARKRSEEKRQRLELQMHQAQKMEAVGSLAGGIAHDFNNILGIILGNTELALQDIPAENPACLNLHKVVTACLRARDLVRQILAFSRHAEQEQAPLRISHILKEGLRLLRSSLPTTIEIRQHIETRSDTVLADPTKIHQILLNLCTNAAHAMRKEGGVLDVSLTDEVLDSETASRFYDLSPGAFVKLTVNDNGHGIEPFIRERIFDPYFTTKEPEEGTGMGLAVVHGIVKRYGGSIIVESEPGKGTAFHVLLPKFKGEVSPAAEPLVQFPGGTESILFVDDEKLVVDTIPPILRRLGYEVESGTSSIECLNVFRQNPEAFDLIITDMTMPNMTGADLAKEAIKIRPDIPIILCTGFSERIDEKRAKEIGIRAFLMKPVITREIAGTIREVLEGK